MSCTVRLFCVAVAFEYYPPLESLKLWVPQHFCHKPCYTYLLTFYIAPLWPYICHVCSQCFLVCYSKSRILWGFKNTIFTVAYE